MAQVKMEEESGLDETQPLDNDINSDEEYSDPGSDEENDDVGLGSYDPELLPEVTKLGEFMRMFGRPEAKSNRNNPTKTIGGASHRKHSEEVDLLMTGEMPLSQNSMRPMAFTASETGLTRTEKTPEHPGVCRIPSLPH